MQHCIADFIDLATYRQEQAHVSKAKSFMACEECTCTSQYIAMLLTWQQAAASSESRLQRTCWLRSPWSKMTYWMTAGLSRVPST